MTRPKAFEFTRKWLARLDEDRHDSELATNILCENQQTYPLEQIKREIYANARTRHRKPRKLE